MAKNRQGGVLGRANNSLSTPKPSGVWDKSDLLFANTQASINPGPKAPQTELEFGSSVVAPDTDIYYPQTVVHLTTEETDWFTKDRSGKNWHWMQQRDNDYRKQPTVRSGPLYPYWSIIFPDSNSYARLNYAANAGHSLGAGTFTIDFWFKRTVKDGTERYIMGRGNQPGRTAGLGWTVGWHTDYRIFFYDAVANVTHSVTGVTFLADTWYFVSICRAGTGASQFTISIDGTNRYTGTCATDFNDSNDLRIGSDRTVTPTTCFSSVIADIRISSNSTPTPLPTGPLDMTGAKYSHSITTKHWESAKTTSNTSTQPQGYTTQIVQYCYKDITNPWEDDPTHAGYKWNVLTGKGSSSIYSYYHHGYLILDKNANDTSLRFGTGPFTIEAWIWNRHNGVSHTNARICGKGVDQSTGWCPSADHEYMRWESNNTTVNNPYSYGDARGVWNHVAYVREGTGTNQFYMYLNGVRVYQGTDSSNYSGNENLYVLLGRNSASGFMGMLSGLRLSNVARYTTASFTPDIETSLTADANVVYMVHSPPNDTSPVSSEPQLIDHGFGRQNIYTAVQHGVLSGSRGPYGRWGQSVADYWQYGTECVICYSPVGGYWTLGTADFSLEFWHRIKDRRNSFPECCVDFRSNNNWNANSLSIYFNGNDQGNGAFYVLRNGQIFLSSISQYSPLEWRHVCLTRINNVFRLYINGKIQEERYDASSITDSSNRLTLFNGSYNVDYGRNSYSYMKDFRLDKNVSAYPAGDTIPVPKSELQPTANTAVLTLNGLGLHDTRFSGTGDVSVWDGYYDAYNYGRPNYSWDVLPSSASPYLVRPKINNLNSSTDIVLDTGSCYTLSRYWESYKFLDYDTDASWYTRLDKPFTFELFWFQEESSFSSPTARGILYNAHTPGHRGIQIVSNYYNGSPSYNTVNVRWYANDTVYSYNTYGNWDHRSQKSHAWNHVAVSFDPSQAAGAQWAIFMNGYRQVLTSPPAPNNLPRTTYCLIGDTQGIGPVRISTNVRYNHLQSTYEIPKYFRKDVHTYFTAVEDERSWTNNTRQQEIYNYGPNITDNCKMPNFGNNILLLSNETVQNKINRLNVGMYYWSDNTNWWWTSTDYTIECWANWQPASQGGKNFDTYQFLWDFWNSYQVGLNSSGQWMFWRATTNNDGTLTTYSNMSINTGIACRLTTSGLMDHVVMMRRSQNTYCFLNGILVGTLIDANFGTSSYAANSNSPQYNWYFDGTYAGGGSPINNYMRLGCDWHTLYNRSWQGCINDFRWTKTARYDVAAINGVNTMVHRGTRTPALPTRRFPRNEQRAT